MTENAAVEKLIKLIKAHIKAAEKTNKPINFAVNYDEVNKRFIVSDCNE